MDELENGGQSTLNSGEASSSAPGAESESAASTSAATSTESSSSSQADAANGSGESLNSGTESSQAEQQRRVSEAVPYSRFQEQNDRLRQAETELSQMRPWAELGDILRNDPSLGPYIAQGLSPKQAVERFQADQRQRQIIEQQTGQYHQSLQSLVDQEQMTPEAMQALAPLIEELAQVKPIAMSWQQQQSEARLNGDIESVLKDFGKADRESVRLALLQTNGNIPYARELAQRQHAAITSLEQTRQEERDREIAAYNAAAARRDSTVSVESGNGGESSAHAAKSTIPDPGDREAFGKYLESIRSMPRRAYG